MNETTKHIVLLLISIVTFLCVPEYMYMHYEYEETLGNQTMALDPLKLELQKAMSQYLGARN